MLRFRLGPIPVEVHPSHLLLVGVLALSFAASPLSIALWMGLISFSVLFHELGHALVSLAFGYQPSIQLAWLGGNTRPSATAPIPWHRDVLLTLAGPGFGLGLAGACFLLRHRAGAHPSVAVMLVELGRTNVLWSLLNLVPVLPMDGGRITYAVLTRVLGKRGAVAAWGLSTLTAAVLALAAARIQFTWGALLFGMFAFQAARTTAAVWQGQREVAEPPELLQARALFKAGDYARAQVLAEALAGPEHDPRLRSRAEHLLGWIALKEGKGRAALDHFSLASRQPVEREALAAAFSLVGDDVRALPLWELAQRERPSPTLLHEWGATLLRLGRAEEAARLPGLELPLAYGFAERVFSLREQFREAAQMGERAFELSPAPQRAYDIACACARAGMAQQAVAWLERATSVGFTDVQKAERDPDLASLHGRSDFSAWREKSTRP